MPTTTEASFIASTVLSVVRDRSISSAYGLFLAKTLEVGGRIVIPPLDVFFSEKVGKRLAIDITEKLGGGALNLPLYSGEGDLLGQLSKLLIVCNEKISSDNPKLIDNANKSIKALGFEASIDDGQYVKHLRNAIHHGHFEALKDDKDPLQAKLHLWDKQPRGKCETTADYKLSGKDLSSIIDVLIEKVCLEYLDQIGWELA